jgi:lytic murein transglycosylase
MMRSAVMNRRYDHTVRLAVLVISGVVLFGSVGAVDATANDRSCRNTGSFANWKRDFRREVAASGVNERVIRAAYDPIVFDPNIIRRDRRQSFFSMSFVDFSNRLVSSNRLKTGARKLTQRADWFRKAEQKYGVPAPVITAFWALESDFGAGISKQSLVFNSLATLAYDCRRPEMFRQELISALKIVDRGYLPLSRMTGSWAGELGQTQFLPSHYLNHAVDADGDGERNMIDSDPDIIFSTANYIQHIGWRRGEPWLEEVRVPGRMPWREADLEIYHPRAKWSEWGVTRRDGRHLPRDRTEAALLLPMGRNGPAFLAYRNFQIYPQWNQSLNYAITAAYLATRLDGAPRYLDGNGPVDNFGYKDIKALQEMLNSRGYDTGGVDGTLGARTRAAVKKAQIRFGLPADSYPSRELIERLRGR